MSRKDQGAFGNWLNRSCGTKHLIIGFIIWTIIYRLIDSQTLDWFGKDNDLSVIMYFFGLLAMSAVSLSVVVLILFPILKFLGLYKGDL